MREILEALTVPQALMLGAALGALGLSFVALVGVAVAASLEKATPPRGIPPWTAQAPYLNWTMEELARAPKHHGVPIVTVGDLNAERQ
jgi:hypothetical protein